MIEILIREDVQQFIFNNENVDPFELSLKHKTLFGLPTQIIADQIAARKKAKTKLPEWYATKGIVYPPLISMEQCSSEITAKHKTKILSGESLIDLTGGAGIDTFYLSKVFEHVIYVERNATLCEIAKHNFQILGATNIEVVHGDSEKFINTYDKKVSAIFIDPARRSESNQKVFLWSDCEPDIQTLQGRLLLISKNVLIKASPILDVSAGASDLNDLKSVHIVSLKNECKELLYLLGQAEVSKEITTVNYKSNETAEYFSFNRDEETETKVTYEKPKAFLYEPNSSIMKSGAFKVLGAKLDLKKLHPNTHLYTSENLVEGFPGRVFSIEAVVKYDKKEIFKHLPQKKANIAVRNFPDDVATIRKKTRIQPGGEVYIFATTLYDNQKAMIICHKEK